MDVYAALRHLFCKVFCPCTCKGKCKDTGKIKWTLTSDRFTLVFATPAQHRRAKGEFKMQLPNDKSVNASLSFMDAKGNVAIVDGAPVWSTDREDLIAIVSSPDGMSANITPLGPVGIAQVVVVADADLGAGVTEVTCLGELEILAGSAVAGVLNFSVN